jgi:hypothetical protein
MAGGCDDVFESLAALGARSVRCHRAGVGLDQVEGGMGTVAVAPFFSEAQFIGSSHMFIMARIRGGPPDPAKNNLH